MSTATAAKERPILFSAPMVRAILEGRKCQTRRVVKHDPSMPNYFPLAHVDGTVGAFFSSADSIVDGVTLQKMWCPYGKPGDLLWVRETWKPVVRSIGNSRVYYAADKSYREDERAGPLWTFERGNRLRPSIHMPRWASRITLRVTNVRVERVRGISEVDAKAEGCEPVEYLHGWQGYRETGGKLHHCQSLSERAPEWMVEPRPYHMDDCNQTAIDSFATLWDTINGKTHPWESNPWVWVVEFERIEP